MSEVIEVLTSPTVVEVVLATGPQGPQGEQGIQGIQGIPGVGTPPSEVAYTPTFSTISGTAPTFSSTPLVTGSYAVSGVLTYFRIEVELDNVTNFGTGQYYVTLPFTPLRDFITRDGSLVRASNGTRYALNGHALAESNMLRLYYSGSSSHDEIFDHDSPHNLATEDTFQISGTYLQD